MTLNDIHDEVATLRAAILESCTPHEPQDAGLDRRCGTLYLAEDYLVSTQPASLEYFSSIGYIDQNLITRIGDLTIYPIEDHRVLSIFQTLEHNHD